MNPLVEKYMKDKFGENYDQNNEQVYNEQLDRSSTGNLFSNIGDVIAGNKVGSNNQFFQNQNALVKENTIGKADKAKKDFAADYDLDHKIKENDLKAESAKNDSDPNHVNSKIAQSLFIKMGGNPEQAKSLTAAKFKGISDSMEKIYKIEQDRLNRIDARDAKAREKLMYNKDILHLPAENQEVVKDLARKNASKLGIANQIDAVMSNWDSLTEDQQVAQGRQLLKVLNSTEGADAIGSEEANRLGSKVEFAMGNIFNSNPVQFGRDLPGFKEQATGTSKAIRGAISSNNQTIDKMYENVGIKKDAGSGYSAPKNPEDLAALKWANENPNDPRAEKILKRLNNVGNL